MSEKVPNVLYVWFGAPTAARLGELVCSGEAVTAALTPMQQTKDGEYEPKRNPISVTLNKLTLERLDPNLKVDLPVEISGVVLNDGGAINIGELKLDGATVCLRYDAEHRVAVVEGLRRAEYVDFRLPSDYLHGEFSEQMRQQFRTMLGVTPTPPADEDVDNDSPDATSPTG